jgi:signal transduction histidine kinase
MQDQLRQSSKLEAVGRLAAGVTHEFSNVLTVILGYCSLLLLDGGSRSERNEKLTAISVAAGRAADLTKNLLMFGRKETLHSRRFDLHAVIIAAIPRLRGVAGELVTLKTHLGATNATIMADKSEIELLLVNLAANAHDAMPAGGTLTISTADSPSTVVLEVSDTGAGMSGQVADHLFEPFFTTKEPGKGVGLGLAAVYGVVTRSGGHIDVETRVNGGTRFSIHFPFLGFRN